MANTLAPRPGRPGIGEVGVYVSAPPPLSLAHGFHALATWTHKGGVWESTLAADAGFEIAWSGFEGRIDGRIVLSPPHLRPQIVRVESGPCRIRTLRLRPETVGAWIGEGTLASSRLELCDLGSRWRKAATACTEAELLDALAQIEPDESDPVVLASLARLREPRPLSFREIASETGYSYEQWRRRMRRGTGVSPKFFARYDRLQRATRLARQRPAMGMGEIAFRTGYASDAALAAEATEIAGRTFRRLVAEFTLPE